MVCGLPFLTPHAPRCSLSNPPLVSHRSMLHPRTDPWSARCTTRSGPPSPLTKDWSTSYRVRPSMRLYRARVQAGSGDGVHNSARRGADVIISTGLQHFQQCGNITTVSGGGAASKGYRYNLADLVATNRLTPAPAHPAAAAASVSWPGSTAGQEQEQ